MTQQEFDRLYDIMVAALPLAADRGFISFSDQDWAFDFVKSLSTHVKPTDEMKVIQKIRSMCENEIEYEDRPILSAIEVLDIIKTSLTVDSKRLTLTDYDKMVVMLTTLGVEFNRDGNSLVLETHTEKVTGYIGFGCYIVFDSEGKFLHFDLGES